MLTIVNVIVAEMGSLWERARKKSPSITAAEMMTCNGFAKSSSRESGTTAVTPIGRAPAKARDAWTPRAERTMKLPSS